MGYKVSVVYRLAIKLHISLLRLEKEKQRKNFRTILGFKEHDIVKVTEKTTLDSIENAFEGENIQTH